MDRTILYLKVPAFPIALERLRESSLRGRPVALCASGSGRAPLQAVSPEAVREGLFKGMARHQAERICPGLVVLPPDPAFYREAAAPLFRLLSDFSPLVEPLRGGALFLDLSGTRRLLGPPRDLAWRIRKEVRGRLGLLPRLGISGNKLMSRIAVKVLPEEGLCDVFPGGERHFLAPQEVRVLPAARLGPCTERLRDFNVERVADLLPIPLPALELAFGRTSLPLFRQARGLDASPVRPPARSPRITEEETLPEESNEDAWLRGVLRGLVEDAGKRLREMRCEAGRLELEIQYADGILGRRTCRLHPPTDRDAPLFEAAGRLLEQAACRRVRLRRLTVHAAGLTPHPQQPGLFPDPFLLPSAARDAALQGALDEIRDRFGKGAVRRGRQGQKARPGGQVPDATSCRDPQAGARKVRGRRAPDAGPGRGDPA